MTPVAKQANSASPAPGPMAPARNLVHVVLDAARADLFRPFSPGSPLAAAAAEGLASQGVSFSLAHANATWTLPSVASFLSGRYPRTFIANHHGARVPRKVRLLPEHLRAHGFQTAAFVTNPYLSRAHGLIRGWDQVWDHPYNMLGVPSDAAPLYAAVIDWLRHKRDPRRRFYLSIHAMDTHLPNHPRPPHTMRLLPPGGPKLKGAQLENQQLTDMMERPGGPTPTDRRWARAFYEGEAAHHDQHLSTLLAELGRLGLLEQTVVVFHADHGEMLMEHGIVEHGGEPHEGVVRVPLLLRFPGAVHGGTRLAEVVELVDLLPTALETLSLPPMPGVQGASLLPLVQGHGARFPPYALMSDREQVIRLGSYKLFQAERTARLFNLTLDPGEVKDLASRQPIARRACEVYLGEGLAVPVKARRFLPRTGPSAPGPVKTRAVLDAKMRQRLRSLGYIND